MNEVGIAPEAATDTIETFCRLYNSTNQATMSFQTEAVWLHLRSMLTRIDNAVKDVHRTMAANAVKSLGIRRRHDSNEAFAMVGSCWLNGYVFARIVYGSALTRFHYSASEHQARLNAKRLIEFSEAIELDTILSSVPEEVAAAARSVRSHEPRLVRKYGETVIEGAAVTSYGDGIRMSIAEQELFGTSCGIGVESH